MKSSKKAWLIFLIVVVLFSFIIMGISFAKGSGGKTTGDGIAGVVLKPFQTAFSFVSNKTSDFFEFWVDMKTLKEENLALSEEVDKLNAQNRELLGFRAENERLRELLALKESGSLGETVGCDIIAKDPGNWFNIFTLDKGQNDGISVNDVVVTAKGVVGRISEVTKTTSKVVSIIDVNSSVGALVTRTQDIGSLDGELALGEEGLARLNYITSGAKLVSGDTIETSGLGGIFPKGLLIGTVTEAKDSVSGLSGYAIVKPAVDFERIREVLVIKKQ